jgi:hypothetical protein
VPCTYSLCPTRMHRRFTGPTVAEIFGAHCRSPLKREIFSLIGFGYPVAAFFFLPNVRGPGALLVAFFDNLAVIVAN